MSRQVPMDRCNCWDKTEVKLIIEHCPSLNDKVRAEIDKIIHFANDQTIIRNYGKVTFGQISEAQRSHNDVPTLSPTTDLRTDTPNS